MSASGKDLNVKDLKSEASPIVNTQSPQSPPNADNVETPKELVLVKYTPDTNYIPRQSPALKAVTDGAIAAANRSALEKAKALAAKANKDKPQQGFEGPEHTAIGNAACKEFYEDILAKDPEVKKIIEDNPAIWDTKTFKFQFKYFNVLPGEIVSLAGDHFGPTNKDEVISFAGSDLEKEARFLKSYKMLENATGKEIDGLIAVMNRTATKIRQAVKEGKKPSVAMEKDASASNSAFADVTSLDKLGASSWLPYPLNVPGSRYGQLAKWNFDHFGTEAEEAYKAGHRVACKTAEEARQKKNFNLFIVAMTQELFALHYLTDLFSAGHVQTVRGTIYKFIEDHHKEIPTESARLSIAGLCAMEMHNEDGHMGIKVRNEESKATWDASGDDCYFDPDYKENRIRVIKAAVTSLKDLYTVYKYQDAKPLPIPYSALKHIPRPLPADQQNHTPLFVRQVDGSVAAREEPNNPKCTKYDSKWSPTIFLVKRYGHRMLSNAPRENATLADQDVALVKKELLAIQEVGCKVG